MDTEALRMKFRPRAPRVVLVGESPPQGGTLFFAGDSRLAAATRSAFGQFLGTDFPDVETFLRRFQGMGFYLEDLCAKPVNGLCPAERRVCREEGIPRLAKRLQAHQPLALIIIIMRAIRPYIIRAAQLAGLRRLPTYVLPFPAYQHASK